MPAPSAGSKNKNRGYLAPNKKGADSHPDFRGKLTLQGQEYLLSGWYKNNTSASGETVQLISLEATDPASLPSRPQSAAPHGAPSAAPKSSTPPSPTAPSPVSGAPGAVVLDDIFGTSTY